MNMRRIRWGFIVFCLIITVMVTYVLLMESQYIFDKMGNLGITATMRVMERDGLSASYLKEEHVYRVAWRIIKDWVEAQMALLETEMVKIEQIFLPYIITKDGKTVYEIMAGLNFQLPEGRD